MRTVDLPPPAYPLPADAEEDRWPTAAGCLIGLAIALVQWAIGIAAIWWIVRTVG